VLIAAILLLTTISVMGPRVAAETPQWIRQFGTALNDNGFGVAADASGIFVVGETNGALPGQTSAGAYDAFLRKYDASGTEVWTREFGSSSDDLTLGVAVDSSGVYVVGNTNGALPGQTNAGGLDAFLRKYDASGTEVWTRQFGTTGFDSAEAVALDASGAYVVGLTSGALPGQTNAGGNDAFVRKYDGLGNELWTRESGWSNTAENRKSGAYGIAQALGHGPTNQYPAGPANPPTSDPRAQVEWGLGYIANTYGDPCAAWAHEESQGWY